MSRANQLALAAYADGARARPNWRRTGRNIFVVVVVIIAAADACFALLLAPLVGARQPMIALCLGRADSAMASDELLWFSEHAPWRLAGLRARTHARIVHSCARIVSART